MNLGKWALLAGGFVIATLIIIGVFFSNFSTSLSHPDQVRGLITFFFVVATTGIIVLFALAIFWVDNADEMTKRLAAAKDLLTVVIGVLGTIMGFYFGTATSEGGNMSIAGAVLTPPVIHTGQSATISGQINGGAKPYKYTVIFADPNHRLTQDQLTKMSASGDAKDGAIFNDKITVPADLKQSMVVFYTLTATDSKNVAVTANGALYLEPGPAQ